MDNTPIKPSHTSTTALKPINKGVGKGKGKGKGKKSLGPAKARSLPHLNEIPGLTLAQSRILQRHLIEPTYYRDEGGRNRVVTIKRKIYYFCRLIGMIHTKSLVTAGYREYKNIAYMTGDKGASGALKTYWDIDSVNLNYILDRLVNLVQEGKNENSRVRALKLLSELKGYYTTRSVVDINEHLQVNFSMSGPVLCPHCGLNILHPPPAGSQLSPGQPDQVIEGEYSVT